MGGENWYPADFHVFNNHINSGPQSMCKYHNINTLKSFLLIILIPLFWDIFKLIAISLSRFLGYNLYLDQSFGYFVFAVKGIPVTVFSPLHLPSVQEIGFFRNIAISATSYNKSWNGILAYGAFLFLSGLVSGGYYGTLKDCIRKRTPNIRTFTQFSWYYGPRLFLVLLLQNLFFLTATVFIGETRVNTATFFLKIIFMFLPYLIVMEDYGFFEALGSAPSVFIQYLRYIIRIIICIISVTTAFSWIFHRMGSPGWIAAFCLWPIIGTGITYKIMLLFNDIVMKEHITERPREQIRGYGKSTLKSVLVVVLTATILGLPTFLCNIRYADTLLPWHKPVILREGFIYQTEGARVYTEKNNFRKAKLVIDSLTPSKDDILYTKPGLIRGKGRLIIDSGQIYFTFELTKTTNYQGITYSLQNGGKVEATDGLWGNPVDRGMTLVIDGQLNYISGIIYDKMDYSEFDTLWSPEKRSVFLSPTPNKSELYGFYSAQEPPESPVEFQWIYNTALPIIPEGERDSLKLMEKINIAFETLDRDMLLNILYYVKDLKPNDILAVLKESFSNYRWVMQAKGLRNWEQTIKTNVSYYPVSNEKITLMGDYFFLQDKISFRADLFRIGQRWKITRMSIKN
jgi:hypothetical protein